jgi:hypothetical protein
MRTEFNVTWADAALASQSAAQILIVVSLFIEVSSRV